MRIRIPNTSKTNSRNSKEKSQGSKKCAVIGDEVDALRRGSRRLVEVAGISTASSPKPRTMISLAAASPWHNVCRSEKMGKGKGDLRGALASWNSELSALENDREVTRASTSSLTCSESKIHLI
jgi:hypothetical protein